ncbi:unnamed protein product, partial [Heterosigma akashiwo]
SSWKNDLEKIKALRFPSTEEFNEVISKCARGRDFDAVLEVLQTMTDSGLTPTAQTYQAIVL